MPVPIIFDVSFFSTLVENDKEKILEILGRVSEKKKLDKLKQKYKELYDKVKKLWKALTFTVPCMTIYLNGHSAHKRPPPTAPFSDDIPISLGAEGLLVRNLVSVLCQTIPSQTL